MSAIDEQLQPELLKIVNDVFEFDLPLGHMTVDHNSEVSFHYGFSNEFNQRKYIYSFI